MDSFRTLFGSGSDLTEIQMALRAAVIFLVALFMLRVAGRRSFGQRTAFDICVGVLLGAVLSRAVVGASPFLPTVCAGAMIVLLHRVLAMASMRWEAFDSLINGRPRVLVNDGIKDQTQISAALITERELAEAIRKETGQSDVAGVKRVVLEQSGEISVDAKG